MPNPTTVRNIIIPSELQSKQPLWNPRLRWGLVETWGKKPGIAGDTDPADFSTQAKIRTYTAANKEWVVTGTNATSATTAYQSTGGITITPTSSASDQAIVSPMVINSVQQSAWGGTNWSLTRNPEFNAEIMLGSMTTTDILVHVALKQTANLNTTTDNNQVGVRLDSATSTNGQLIPYQSIAGTDSDITPRYAFTPTASTPFHLAIIIDNNRVPHFYIDGNLWADGSAWSTSAFTGTTTWQNWAPVFGSGVVTTVQTALTVKSVWMSRLHVAQPT